MKIILPDGSVQEAEDELRAIRHTASHVLAQAVKRLYPDTKLAIGPAIDDGFYYDFDREGGFTAAFGRQKLTGSYEYDAGSHTVSVRPSDEKLEKIGAVSGRAYVSGSELQLLFPVTKLLELAKDVSSQAASLEAASALLANYKNLYIGFSFKK